MNQNKLLDDLEQKFQDDKIPYIKVLEFYANGLGRLYRRMHVYHTDREAIDTDTVVSALYIMLKNCLDTQLNNAIKEKRKHDQRTERRRQADRN